MMTNKYSGNYIGVCTEIKGIIEFVEYLKIVYQEKE